MNSKTMELLEYNKVKEILKGFALSDITKENIDKLEPSVDIRLIEKNIKETTEARAIVDISSSVPIHSLKGVKDVKQKLEKGGILSPEDLSIVASLLDEVKKLKRFMNDKGHAAPTISTYALSAYELDEVREEIERCIANGRVDDKASSELSKVRKKINILEDRVKSKLDSMLRNEKLKSYFQDVLVSQRDGRYVIPVKNEYRRSIDGNIHDKSSSGSTVFIEPAEVKKAQDELNLYKIEEDKEIYKILSTLTGMVSTYERELNINIEIMTYYDFIFSKGKYSKSIDGRSVKLNNNKYINIIKGKHPLMVSYAVPLDFSIGENYKGVVITGPNTGGKTVVLKTVGLLSMMVQSGLHVPVDEGSEFTVFADILGDIGDGQSIEQNLSTFSSHISNIINILDCADRHTLVILDEVGSGTDPGEGMGLAVAILEEMYNKGCLILATTHYSEIKDFAEKSEGFINGSMEFDINTLKPVYRLHIGKAGESNAFLIALRLGMDKKIIERAHMVTYKEERGYSKYVLEFQEKVLQSKKHLEIHEQQIEKMKEAEKNIKNAEKLNIKPKFNVGDNVYISFMNRTGIICETENSKGEYCVMVMKKKLKINKQRLSLYIDNKELYPEDYDFDIVFKSKDDRKKNKIMSKKHVEGVKIEVNSKEV
jgi:DNA mismatch repair protein MutS2